MKGKSTNVKKLFRGVGYNSKGKHRISEGGVKTLAYRVWKSLIIRCYCEEAQKIAKTYKGCSISPIWHDYQNFAEWYTNHPYHSFGYQLDKDILVKGNKIYSPETCCLVPHAINSLFNNHRASKGLYPQGLSLIPSGRYRVQMSVNGNKTHLGVFDTIDEASYCYARSREAYVKDVAKKWQSLIAEDVYNTLMNWEFIEDTE